jgi:hypothetical protein
LDFNHDGKIDFDIDPDDINLTSVSFGTKNLVASSTISPGRFVRLAVLGQMEKSLPLKASFTYKRTGKVSTYSTGMWPTGRQTLREPNYYLAGDKVRNVRVYQSLTHIKYFGDPLPTYADIASLPELEGDALTPQPVATVP